MGLLSQQSVSALYPGTNFPATPELALYWRSVDKFGSLDIATVRSIPNPCRTFVRMETRSRARRHVSPSSSLR
jgi:hypothetical protein